MEKKWFCEIKSDFCDKYCNRYCDEKECPSANALAEWNKMYSMYGIPGMHIKNIKELVGTEAFQCLNVAYDEKCNTLDYQSSAVVLDPEGDVLRETEWLMKEKGYQIKVLNLITMDKSQCYNPLDYLHSINDIKRLRDAFCAHTFVGSFGYDNLQRNEAEMGLFLVLLYYIARSVPEAQRNISLLIHLLDTEEQSILDKNYSEYLYALLERLGIQRLPKAIKIYKHWKSISPKDVKDIIGGLMRRLSIFDIEPLKRIVQCDEMDLDSLGNQKTALYVVIPRNDKRFDFLVSILFSHLFHQYNSKQKQKNPVRFLVGGRHCAHPVADYSQLLYCLRRRDVYGSTGWGAMDGTECPETGA